MDSATPILNIRGKLQRRRTIDTVQRRQYSSRRTPFQQLQDIFRSSRGRSKNSGQSTSKEEQIALENKKPTVALRRTSSVGKDNDTANNQRYHRHRIPRRSDTVAIV